MASLINYTCKSFIKIDPRIGLQNATKRGVFPNPSGTQTPNNTQSTPRASGVGRVQDIVLGQHITSHSKADTTSWLFDQSIYIASRVLYFIFCNAAEAYDAGAY